VGAQAGDADPAKAAFAAATSAVFAHGNAAGRTAMGPLRASDLIEAMRAAAGG
jgi:hypothetical protein